MNSRAFGHYLDEDRDDDRERCSGCGSTNCEGVENLLRCRESPDVDCERCGHATASIALSNHDDFVYVCESCSEALEVERDAREGLDVACTNPGCDSVDAMHLAGERHVCAAHSGEAAPTIALSADDALTVRRLLSTDRARFRLLAREHAARGEKLLEAACIAQAATIEGTLARMFGQS